MRPPSSFLLLSSSSSLTHSCCPFFFFATNCWQLLADCLLLPAVRLHCLHLTLVFLLLAIENLSFFHFFVSTKVDKLKNCHSQKTRLFLSFPNHIMIASKFLHWKVLFNKKLEFPGNFPAFTFRRCSGKIAP